MRREVEIVNKLGLHARPASEFVRCVIRFKSTITIWKGAESFSATSILEVLSSDLDCGARIVIEATGPDEDALDDLEALLLRFRREMAFGSTHEFRLSLQGIKPIARDPFTSADRSNDSPRGSGAKMSYPNDG